MMPGETLEYFPGNEVSREDSGFWKNSTLSSNQVLSDLFPVAVFIQLEACSIKTLRGEKHCYLSECITFYALNIVGISTVVVLTWVRERKHSIYIRITKEIFQNTQPSTC